MARPPFLGILMLDTRFPRLPGDVGHPASWSMPVRLRVVPGASPRRVVLQGDDTLLLPFIEAARVLVAEGAAAITTSCGFLVRWQTELQAALPVPVWTSSLLALPGLPRAGVLTVDATSFDRQLLQVAGTAASVPVQGLAPGCSLHRTLLQDLPELDAAAAEADTVAAALRLVQHPAGIDDIVLECTNLPPYAAAVQRATGRPVHHLMSLVHERWKSL